MTADPGVVRLLMAVVPFVPELADLEADEEPVDEDPQARIAAAFA